MIFPIGDDQVKGGTFPLFSYSFIALNIVIFILQMQYTNLLICEYGSIPNEILRGEDLHTLMTSMFMHGGVMHLVGNMLFLWVFADNIEAVVGNIAFIGFYIIGGLAASVAHILIGYYLGPEPMGACCMPCATAPPCEMGMLACPGTIPSVGASGAIAAVMGAYLVMFPSSRIKMWAVFTTFKIPALLFLGFWIVNQSLSGTQALTGSSGGVAWWAHIGGFAFGAIAGFFGRGSVKNHYKKSKQNKGKYPTYLEEDFV